MANCPKCKSKVDDKDIVCKKCGKVLKLKCPRCGTLNKKAVCTKCKLKILIRCIECGQINPISERKCKKCGASVPFSAIAKNAKLKEFAIVCIDFYNLNKLVGKLGDIETCQEFKKSLYKAVEAEALKNKCGFYEIDDNLVSIDLSQKDTLGESCDKAVDIALNLTTFFEKLNKKLKEQKKISLKTKIGISTKLISEKRLSSREERAIQAEQDTEVIVNDQIYKYTKGYYDFEPLISTFTNNQVITFYKLLTRLYKLDEQEAIKSEVADIPDYKSEEEFNNYSLLEFPELKKNLSLSKPLELQDKIEEIIKISQEGFFTNIMGDFKSGKLRNIDIAKLKEKHKNVNVLEFYCAETFKYYPFGLIRNIIRNCLNLGEFNPDKQKENYFIKSKITTMLGSDCVELVNLLILEEPAPKNIDEIRYKLFKQIGEFFYSYTHKKKTLFLINDFDYIDKGSFDCFKYIIENKIINSNICFIISTTPEYNLSKNISRLNAVENYHEILIKNHTKEEIYSYCKDFSRNFEKSYFFEKIIAQSKGSVFYVNQAMNYLLENRIVKHKSAKYELDSHQVLPIPNTIEDIARTRVQKLFESRSLGEIYIKLLLLGGQISIETIKLISNKPIMNEIKALAELRYIDATDSNRIIIKNYNLYRNITFNIIENKKLNDIATELLQIIPNAENIQDPIIAELFEYSGKKKQACNYWNGLAHLALLIGDVCTFTSCSLRFLNNLETASIEKQENSEKFDINKYNEVKFDIYEQIGKLNYEFYPDEAFDFLKEVIDEAEKKNDFDKLVKMSSLIVHSCNLSGNYVGALDYLKKIIQKAPKELFDVEDSKFSIKFYLLNFIKIQALFNLGKIQESLELAKDVLYIMYKIKQRADIIQNIPVKILDDVIRDIKIMMIKSKILQLDATVEDDLKTLSYEHPDIATTGDVLGLIYKSLCGITPDVKERVMRYQISDLSLENKLGIAIAKIICNIQSNEWQEILDTAYSVRFIAQEQKEFQIFYLLNLFIGIAYKEIINPTRAREIFEDTLKISANKNILNIMLFNWYLIAKMELEKGSPDIALNIINKANIILETNNKTGRIFSIYFKYLQSLIFIKLGQMENAQGCIEHALSIAKKSTAVYLELKCSNLLIKLLQSSKTKTPELEEKVQTLVIRMQELTSGMKNTSSSMK